MARLWYGNDDSQLIDSEVVDALQHLDDSFFIFLETDFDDRNADITIVRASDDRSQPSTMIVTEVKHFSRAVRGSNNGLWERETDNGTWELLPGCDRDISPYRQAVNTANAVANWLFNYQRFFLAEDEILPSDCFSFWPDLLLLSPASVRHQLPLRTPNNYGFWFERIDAWVQHLVRWAPKRGTGLAACEIETIAASLRLAPYEVPSSSPAQVLLPRDPIAGVSDRLKELETQVAAIQQEIKTIRARFSATASV